MNKTNHTQGAWNVLAPFAVILATLVVASAASARTRIDPYGNLSVKGRVLGEEGHQDDSDQNGESRSLDGQREEFLRSLEGERGEGPPPPEHRGDLRVPPGGDLPPEGTPPPDKRYKRYKDWLEKCKQFPFGSEEFYRCKRKHAEDDLDGPMPDWMKRCAQFPFGSEEFYACKKQHGGGDDRPFGEGPAWLRTCRKFGFGTEAFYRCKAEQFGVPFEELRKKFFEKGGHIRFEREGDRFRIRAKDEAGETADLGDDDFIVIDEHAGTDRVTIRTARDFAIIDRNAVQAVTHFPLSVDLKTNVLTVRTPAGERQVTVLPDQAVRNMLAQNVMDEVGGRAYAGLVSEAEIDTSGKIVTISESEGTPAYRVEGVKNHRLFGVFRVTTDVTVTVSVETGEILDTERSFFDTVVDIFSTDA